MRDRVLHTLVGAYVMDAVPEADRIAFERHLTGCEQCRDEVRGLREATARLGAAAAVEPRPALRDQTLQAAARLRQVPPLVTGQPGGPARSRTWRHSWLTMAAAAFAIAFAGAAIGLGVHLSSMQHSLTATEQRDHAIARVLGQPDATTLTAKVTTGGTATVVMSHRVRALVFMGNRLSSLPSSEAYELWIMRPGGDVPAGMLPLSSGGMSGPMVVSGLQPGDQIGLTIEPAGGSRQPTSVPIVLVALGP
jgi:Anti-sigma-K factor rskA/Putative zinc-finger